MDSVWPGPNELQVLPKSPELAPTAATRFVHSPDVGGEQMLRVELSTNRLVSVRIVDAAGKPVSGSRVEAVHVDEDETESITERIWDSLIGRAHADVAGRTFGPVEPPTDADDGIVTSTAKNE